MITLHSVKLLWSSKFGRWYAYTSSGALIYFDFDFADGADKLVSGTVYEIMGKIHPPARHVDGGPVFTLIVVAFCEKETVSPS